MSSNVVVVTGAVGFVAYHTIKLLNDNGYEVRGIDLRHWREKAITTCSYMECGDVADRGLLREHLTPGCKVLHLAAVSKFAEADRDPCEAYRSGPGITAVLFEEAARAGVERIVMASTGSVYMPVWNAPINEHHPTQGNSHYAYAKLAAEKVCHLQRKVPWVILRYSHLYGPMKWHGGLIDNFMQRISRGEKPVMYGGFQSNDFCYVADVAWANLAALKTKNVNEVYNVGSGESWTTEEVIKLLREFTGYDGGLDRQPIRAVDAPDFTFDISKASRLLPWRPSWSLADGLKYTIQNWKER
jgi:UDP-glucose 4-epimerase